MTSFGPVSGDVRGNVQFKEGQVTFENGIDLFNDGGQIWHVNGSLSTGAGNGKTWADAYTTIQAAIDAASAFDTILVKPKLMTDFTGDPASYEENLIIPVGLRSLSIIGIGRGRTQGGLPQLKDGSGTTTAILIIRASGCRIANLGFNGAGNTGGGILLDEDYSTKAAFGTTIQDCHFKNCKGHATNGKLGGAIMWSAEGNAWQCDILGNKFYKNVADIVLLGTSNTRPQDILIQGNVFQSSVTSSCDCNILQVGGGGFQTITILDNIFTGIPAIGSGTVGLYIDLTGTQEGMIARNVFGCLGNATATALTFKAGGTGGEVPSTVFFCDNKGYSTTDGENAFLSIA